MMRLSRPLGLLAATSALIAPASAFQSGDAAALFQQGLDALEANDTEAAAEAFRAVIAADPTNEEAYELWQSIDNDAWLDILSQEGQIELAATRIIERARAGRQELRADTGEIRGLLQELEAAADDPIVRREIAFTLASKHGEYVVPLTLPALASSGERSALYVNALVVMGHRVVPPLIAAMDSPEPALRRTVAFVLGQIGDARATGTLMAASSSDSDAGVRTAAGEALASILGTDGLPTSSAADRLVEEGYDYGLERSSVLSPYDYSDVVWRFDGTALVAVSTPRPFYALEVAKQRFMAALAHDPASAGARAGLALVGNKANAKATAIVAAGGDVSAMESRLANGQLQALTVGPEALDSALLVALEAGDEAATIGTLTTLGHVANGVGAGVSQALESDDLRVRGEAAVTAAHASLAAGTAAPANAVSALGDVAGQEILRQVIVIDPNDGRREGLVAAIEGIPGTAVVPAADGSTGLRLLYEVERADAILVADVLPDITADALIQNARGRAALEDAALMLIAESQDAGAPYGGRIDGVVVGVDSVASAVRPALDSAPTVGQAIANDLAARAAGALEALANAGGADLSSAVAGLATAAGRDNDDVAGPALRALAAIGSADGLEAAAGVAADNGRDDAVRVAAADALASMFRGGARPSADQFQALSEILTDSDSADLRRAIARAMGSLGSDGLAELQVDLLGALDPIASE
ncbi:MAG: HEAT repeat domain-containing protein [Planctomycetota bacterium]